MPSSIASPAKKTCHLITGLVVAAATAAASLQVGSTVAPAGASARNPRHASEAVARAPHFSVPKSRFASRIGLSTPPRSASPKPPAPPVTSSCLSLGISSNYQYRANAANAATDLPRLKSLGITSIREDLLWSVVQPESASEWNWGPYDSLFTMASQLGIGVLPIIGYGTTWASAPATVRDMPSTAAGQQAYANFAAAAVARYGPTGSFWISRPDLKTPSKVTTVELWNEPWYVASPSVTKYVALLRLASAAVHSVAPSVMTLANVDDRWRNLPNSDTPYWGQAVLEHAAELKGYVGGWALHPYSEGQWDGLSPAADGMRQVNWLQHLLAAEHAQGNIWITELGFSTAPPPSTSQGYSAYQVPTTAYATFASAAARTTGPNRVTHLWVFTAARPTAATKPGSWDYGYNLVDADGRISSAVQQTARDECA